MEAEHNPKLTCSELGSLWATYMEESMTGCIYKYFIEVIQDTAIRSTVQTSLNYALQRVKSIAEIFNQEKIPVPHGFTDDDVYAKAPSLYSDIFIIRYVTLKASFNMGAFTTAKTLSARADIRKFYTECMNQASSIFDEATDLMLSKGIHVRAPILAYPEEVKYVHQQNNLRSYVFGDQRPLNAIEIAHLGTNAATNLIGKILIMGFSQVAKSEEIRNYFWRGKELAEKLIDKFSSTLGKESIPTPASWDGTLSNSTISPFSDNLMLYQIMMLNVAGMSDYGVSLAISTRSDLVASYAQLIVEVGKYTADGATLMVKSGWLEQPPQTLDRKDLVKV